MFICHWAWKQYCFRQIEERQRVLRMSRNNDVMTITSSMKNLSPISHRRSENSVKNSSTQNEMWNFSTYFVSFMADKKVFSNCLCEVKGKYRSVIIHRPWMALLWWIVALSTELRRISEKSSFEIVIENYWKSIHNN